MNADSKANDQPLSLCELGRDLVLDPNEIPIFSGHRQGEAFRLMKYSSGSEVEWLWNSRNAVTPFTIGTRDERLEMTHIDWSEDLFAPFYVPAIGDRVFIDLTLEQARRYRTAYVEAHWAARTAFCNMQERWETKASAVEELAKADFESFGGHCPDVLVVGRPHQVRFARRALWLIENLVLEYEPERLRHSRGGRPQGGRFA